jgi:hypothetical protein
MRKELVQPTFIRKDSVQTEYPTYLGPVLVEQQPRCNREWDRNPTRQAVKSGPCPRFDGPPSIMKVEVLSSFLLSAHVSKIFTFQIFCSTYIQRNSIKVFYKQVDMGFAAEADFFLGGGRGRFTQKKGVTLHPQATDFQGKKSSASSIRIVSYCKSDMYFNKYDMYSIVGIDKKMYEKGIVITYIHT